MPLNKRNIIFTSNIKFGNIMVYKILIIDDEEDLRGLIAKLLMIEGYEILQASTLSEADIIIKSAEPEIIILDVKLPDGNGIDYLEKIPLLGVKNEVIVLTAYGTIRDGVQAMKKGAFDYITKGDEDNRILPIVGKAIEKLKLSDRIDRLEKQIEKKYDFSSIIGNSPQIMETIDIAKKIAPTDICVLLTGETGTGKEILANAIHNSSLRKKNPFVAINCSAIPSDIFESELFGYKAGAFTGAYKNKKGIFEEADGGTIFLDEIGDMKEELQSKLLRVLESNTFIKPGDTKHTAIDVRIIAATNILINDAIKKGEFRKDLYYRLNGIQINLPPLRERSDDIKLLIDHFLNLFCTKFRKTINNINQNFYNDLMSYSFPGNIRELKNIIERVVILCENNVLTEKNLPPEVKQIQNIGINEFSLEKNEKYLILKALEKARDNKNAAATLLGIGLTTLYR
jgi:DNA-binding NtrC family response regulator